jgi:hypothetical protein
MSNPGTTNLTAWWKMDEPSGTRYDERGNVPLSQSGGVGNETGRNTFSGLCAEFNALNNEYLINGTSTLIQIGPDHATFGFWVRPHAIATDSDIFCKWGDTNPQKEYMIHTVGSKIRFSVLDVNDGYFVVEAGTFGVLSNDTWYFVCAWFDPDTNQIGVGINDVWDIVSVGIYAIRQSSVDFTIGIRDGAGTYFDGNIEDGFFYQNRELTNVQRTWLYNDGCGRRYEDVNQQAPPTIDVMTKRYLPEIYVYDEDLTGLGIIDEYSSLNWADRYNSVGDFELEVPLDYASDSKLNFGNFLYIPTSDKIMIIEEKKPTRTPTDGKLLVNGRSAESILKRRILTQINTWFGPAEFYAYHLVYWSSIAPPDTDRIIDLFEDGSGNPWPPAMETSYLISEQFEGETIYEVIETICKIVDLGFKIIVDGLGVSSPKLYFLIYEGQDRSADQTANNVVIFAEAFDNLLDSSFLTTQKDKINITHVVTDDPVYEKTFVWEGGSDETPGGTEPTGLNRFEGRLETTVNRDSDGDDIDDLTDAEVLAIIEERGEEVVKENTPVAIFDGDVDARTQFILGEDFFVGDIVQIRAHDTNAKARVAEVVKSYTVEGEKIYIAFDFEV